MRTILLILSLTSISFGQAVSVPATDNEGNDLDSLRVCLRELSWRTHLKDFSNFGHPSSGILVSAQPDPQGRFLFVAKSGAFLVKTPPEKDFRWSKSWTPLPGYVERTYLARVVSASGNEFPIAFGFHNGLHAFDPVHLDDEEYDRRIPNSIQIKAQPVSDYSQIEKRLRAEAQNMVKSKILLNNSLINLGLDEIEQQRGKSDQRASSLFPTMNEHVSDINESHRQLDMLKRTLEEHCSPDGKTWQEFIGLKERKLQKELKKLTKELGFGESRKKTRRQSKRRKKRRGTHR